MKNAENDRSPLRVAFLAGTLGQGGAEKQLVYMIGALLRAGVEVRLYTLTHGEHYEPVLRAMGVQPQWIGKHSSPLLRLVTLAARLRDFRPHILQSCHFYTNLYVCLAAILYQAVAVGSIRSDIAYELESNPFWGKLLLNRAGSLIANSHAARQNAAGLGIAPERLNYLPNVIDLQDFDRKCRELEGVPACRGFASKIVLVTVGGLIAAKRLDRFITALSIVTHQVPGVLGVIVGDGPERTALQALASQEGLSEASLVFLGRQDHVPAILKQSHIFILTSDHEGFPNVVLEAMAARLPVITTPAGDCAHLVQDGLTGYVVPHEDINTLAERMIRLALSEELRRTLGQQGRACVEQDYGIDGLGERLLSVYREVAKLRNSSRLIDALSF